MSSQAPTYFKSNPNCKNCLGRGIVRQIRNLPRMNKLAKPQTEVMITACGCVTRMDPQSELIVMRDTVRGLERQLDEAKWSQIEKESGVDKEEGGEAQTEAIPEQVVEKESDPLDL
jgi:hypothetical protein